MANPGRIQGRSAFEGSKGNIASTVVTFVCGTAGLPLMGGDVPGRAWAEERCRAILPRNRMFRIEFPDELAVTIDFKPLVP